jgi:hypothetical protein
MTACDWPGGAEDHAGQVVPVVVSDVAELKVRRGETDLRHLCARHALALDEEADVAPAEVLVPRWVVDDLLKERWPIGSAIFPELLASRSRADTRSPVRPPWHLTGPAFAHLRDIVAARGPMGTAHLDQLRTLIRNELDKLEVSVTDEWSVYHGLVWTGLLTELARNGLENEAIDRATYAAIAQITTTIGAALMEYAPEEARPR